jgi:hypothetical protein
MKNTVWISYVLRVIEEFSSREFQERVWLNGFGPEVSSYEEAMCKLFDDYRFSELIDAEWKQVGLSEPQLTELRNFRDRILEFDKGIPEVPKPTDVLGRAAWADIRGYALKAAQVLRDSMAVS